MLGVCAVVVTGGMIDVAPVSMLRIH
jgi:hypothetical protein